MLAEQKIRETYHEIGLCWSYITEITSGKLAEISLEKAYSLNLDFCDLTEICKNCAIVLQGTNEIALVIDIIIRIMKLKNNSSSGQLYSRWLRECVMGFGAFHFVFTT